MGISSAREQYLVSFICFFKFVDKSVYLVRLPYPTHPPITLRIAQQHANFVTSLTCLFALPHPWYMSGISFYVNDCMQGHVDVYQLLADSFPLSLGLRDKHLRLPSEVKSTSKSSF
jgi:hypothetical protein